MSLGKEGRRVCPLGNQVRLLGDLTCWDPGHLALNSFITEAQSPQVSGGGNWPCPRPRVSLRSRSDNRVRGCRTWHLHVYLLCARLCSKCFVHIISSHPHPTLGGGTTISSDRLGNNFVARGCTACKDLGWNLEEAYLVLKAGVLSMICSALKEQEVMVSPFYRWENWGSGYHTPNKKSDTELSTGKTEIWRFSGGRGGQVSATRIHYA